MGAKQDAIIRRMEYRVDVDVVAFRVCGSTTTFLQQCIAGA